MLKSDLNGSKVYVAPQKWDSKFPKFHTSINFLEDPLD